jgi:enediyne biosynthesis protein E4
MSSPVRHARHPHRGESPTSRHLGWMAAAAIVAAVVVSLGSSVPAFSQGSSSQPPLTFSFTNVARDAGLTDVTVYGGTAANKYLLETTGTGVAVIDYDNDGWLDVFVVNGSVLEGFPDGNVPTSHLYRNQRDGTFRDVTAAAGLTQSGWGQAACSGDYDNDGHDDLFVTYWGQNRLYHNRGDGTFEEVTAAAGLRSTKPRWGTGCAFLDFDRDGRLDLFAANYIDFDLASAPVPESGLCRYKGLPVACGPPGLPGGKNVLYRNAGEGRFEDVSERSGITRANGTYALGVSTLDFNNDGWVDLYVANDSNPSALYINNKDGTFKDVGVAAGCAYSQDGKPQAGMGVAAGDYDRNGTIDLFKTNFAGDTSTLYANDGKGLCEDRTFSAGIGLNTRWLGWGVGFVDLDNDGWLDLFLVNGHVYPEVERLKTEAAYKQRKVVYRNLGNGRFEDITTRLGAPVTTPAAGRGAAFADFDNDGDVDVIVNNMNAPPDLFRLDLHGGSHWTTLKLVGTRSNRSAIGARVTLSAGDATQVQEVRGGGSYFSQNDLRVHFGLGQATHVDRIAVRWPDGNEEQWTGVAIDRIVTLTEGTASRDSAR